MLWILKINSAARSNRINATKDKQNKKSVILNARILPLPCVKLLKEGTHDAK